MRFKIVEEKEIESNNEINKKKYKKHSQSPFVKMNAGNVEYNNEFFNGTTGEPTGEMSSGGEM